MEPGRAIGSRTGWGQGEHLEPFMGAAARDVVGHARGAAAAPAPAPSSSTCISMAGSQLHHTSLCQPACYLGTRECSASPARASGVGAIQLSRATSWCSESLLCLHSLTATVASSLGRNTPTQLSVWWKIFFPLDSCECATS